MHQGRAAADKRASCGYACRDLGGGVSCSSGVTTAAEVQRLLRFAAERTPWSEISRLPIIACAALAASLRRGGSAGRASVRLSIVWTQHANLNVTPVLHELRLHVERRAARLEALDFVQLGIRRPLPRLEEPWHSYSGEVYFRGASPTTTGLLAPRGLGGRALSSGRSPR